MIRELEIPRNIDIDTLANPGKVSGFVSPAEDYAQRRLHIAQLIVKDPINTFYFEAIGNDMRRYGITNGNILIVDRSEIVVSGKIIVCCLEEEWLVRKLIIKGDNKYLCINDSMDGYINISGRTINIFGCVASWVRKPTDK